MFLGPFLLHYYSYQANTLPNGGNIRAIERLHADVSYKILHSILDYFLILELYL